VSVASLGALLEVGAYCGKSTIYLGAAARQADSTLFSLDHHRGSKEHQAGEEFHDERVVDSDTGTRRHVAPLATNRGGGGTRGHGRRDRGRLANRRCALEHAPGTRLRGRLALAARGDQRLRGLGASDHAPRPARRPRRLSRSGRGRTAPLRNLSTRSWLRCQRSTSVPRCERAPPPRATRRRAPGSTSPSRNDLSAKTCGRARTAPASRSSDSSQSGRSSPGDVRNAPHLVAAVLDEEDGRLDAAEDSRVTLRASLRTRSS